MNSQYFNAMWSQRSHNTHCCHCSTVATLSMYTDLESEAELFLPVAVTSICMEKLDAYVYTYVIFISAYFLCM